MKSYLLKINIWILCLASFEPLGAKEYVIKLTPKDSKWIEIEYREIVWKDIQFRIQNENPEKTYYCDFIYNRDSGFRLVGVIPYRAHASYSDIKDKDRMELSKSLQVAYEIKRDLNLPFEIKLVFWEESNPNAKTENIIRIVEERTRCISIQNFTFFPLQYDFGEIDINKVFVERPLKISWRDFPDLKDNDVFCCELSVEDETGQTRIKRNQIAEPKDKVNITIGKRSGQDYIYIIIQDDSKHKTRRVMNRSNIRARLISLTPGLKVIDKGSREIISINWKLKEKDTSSGGILLLFIFIAGTGILVAVIWYLNNEWYKRKKYLRKKSDTRDIYSKELDEGIATPISNSISDKKIGVSYEKDAPFLKIVPGQIDLPSHEFKEARVIRNEWYGPIKIKIEASYHKEFQIRCYGQDRKINITTDKEFFSLTKNYLTQYSKDIYKTIYIWCSVFESKANIQSDLLVQMFVKGKPSLWGNKENEIAIATQKVSCRWNIEEIDRLEKSIQSPTTEFKPTGHMVSAEQEQIKLDSNELRLIKYFRQNQITLAQIYHWQDLEDFYEKEMQQVKSQRPEDKNRIQMLESKINELHKKNEYYVGQLKIKNEKINDLEKKIEQSENIIKQRNKTLAELSRDLKIIQNDQANKNQTSDQKDEFRLISEIKILKEVLVQTRNENEQLLEKLTQVEYERNAAVSEIEALQAKLELFNIEDKTQQSAFESRIGKCEHAIVLLNQLLKHPAVIKSASGTIKNTIAKLADVVMNAHKALDEENYQSGQEIFVKNCNEIRKDRIRPIIEFLQEICANDLVKIADNINELLDHQKI